MKGFEVVKIGDISKNLRKFIKFGKPQGTSTGIKPLDEFYKPIKGGCTDITGYPYSGKTLLGSEIIVGLAQNHGWKGLLYMPDSGTDSDIYSHIIQKLTNKSFIKNFGNAFTEDEFLSCGALEWVHEHFKVLKKVDSKTRLSPNDFYSYTVDNGFDFGFIDSWNYMNIPEGTKSLGEALSFRNELAESSGVHFFNIIHPRNPTATDYNKEGILKAPDVFNLMGGSEWNNNGKNIIVVHKEQKESDIYDIYIRKTKPREVGQTGQITMRFDIPSQRFYSYDQHLTKQVWNIKTMFVKDRIQVQEKKDIQIVQDYSNPNKGAMAAARSEFEEDKDLQSDLDWLKKNIQGEPEPF